MPSARRYRSLFITLVIIVTFTIYVTRGPSMTHDSEFYKRTVKAMEARARGADAYLHRAGESFTHHNKDDHAKRRAVHDPTHAGSEHQKERQEHQQNQPPPPINDKLKARLREAEQLAKKSADDKYRALKDIEQEVSRERAERELIQGQSIAGRKKIPLPAKQDGNQKPQTDIDDESRSREHADEVTLRATYNELVSHSPITIFSKSYCPHSKKAKQILLEAFRISPEPYVVELDLHPRGQELQGLLHQKTGRRTVPNVMVGGESLGGGDEVQSLWQSGEMITKLRQMGGSTLDTIVEKVEFGHDVSADPGL